MRVLMAYLASLPCLHPHPQEDGQSPRWGHTMGRGFWGAGGTVWDRISRTFKNRGQEGKGGGLGVRGGSRAWGTELETEAKPQAAPAQD